MNAIAHLKAVLGLDVSEFHAATDAARTKVAQMRAELTRAGTATKGVAAILNGDARGGVQNLLAGLLKIPAAAAAGAAAVGVLAYKVGQLIDRKFSLSDKIAQWGNTSELSPEMQAVEERRHRLRALREAGDRAEEIGRETERRREEELLSKRERLWRDFLATKKELIAQIENATTDTVRAALEERLEVERQIYDRRRGEIEEQERRAVHARTAAARKENRRLELEMMDTLARLSAQHADAQKELAERIAEARAAGQWELAQALGERARLTTRQYDRDIAQYYASIQEQRAAADRHAAARLQDLEQRVAEPGYSVFSTPGASGLRAVGAASRLERSLTREQEMARTMNDMLKLNRERKAIEEERLRRLEEIVENTGR